MDNFEVEMYYDEYRENVPEFSSLDEEWDYWE